jgi:hypothetical protein
VAGLSTGAIVGIVVVVLVASAALASGIVVVKRRRAITATDARVLQDL